MLWGIRDEKVIRFNLALRCYDIYSLIYCASLKGREYGSLWVRKSQQRDRTVNAINLTMFSHLYKFNSKEIRDAMV